MKRRNFITLLLGTLGIASVAKPEPSPKFQWQAYEWAPGLDLQKDTAHLVDPDSALAFAERDSARITGEITRKCMQRSPFIDLLHEPKELPKLQQWYTET
jgi:hypothetical protein